MAENKSEPLKDRLDTKLREVATVQGPVEAEVIKSLLKSHNIPCLLRGLVVQSVHAFSADGLGKINILVLEQDYETARKILKDQTDP
jgi:hypothetical protein